MIVGSIDIPVSEICWGTWSYNITVEDLMVENCKDFNEFLSKVRTGEINITEYDAVVFETHDSELVKMDVQDAEGFCHKMSDYIKVKRYEDPNGPEEGD